MIARFIREQQLELGPAWRWHLAQQLAEELSTPRRPADRLVREVAKVFRHCRKNPFAAAEPSGVNWQIAAATALQDSAAMEQQLKILVVGGCPRAAIAKRLSLDLSVLKTWERLFFHVRACRKSPGWINRWVIWPLSDAKKYELAAKMRAAYWGGPAAALAVLDAEQGISAKTAERLYQREQMLEIKAQAALDIPLRGPEDALRYLRLHTSYRLGQARLDLDNRRFAQRCQETAFRQTWAQQTLEIARRRDERRAAAEARRAQQRDHEQSLREQFRSQEPAAEKDTCPALAGLGWASRAAQPGIGPDRQQEPTAGCPAAVAKPQVLRGVA